MPEKNTARWARIRELFEAALRLPVEDRDAFVTRSCGSDNDLLVEIQTLLAAHDDDDIELSRIVGGAAADAARSTNSGLLQQRVGNYELVELLGAGGMGNVYLGRRIDEQFEHQVAIKVLQTGGSNQHFVERFRSERQVLANLDHPNIAKLLDGGVTEEGLQFLVMEYIRGEPIDSYCDTHQLDIRQRLRLFQKICLAVDYAHRNLVVHRDVKPSNIIVTDEGVPKLLDFGIAKVMSASDIQRPLTLDSQKMMTPEYASPEQVRGEPVSTVTDVYSLGVLLYRLLCGRGPYNIRSDLPSSLAQAILEDSPSKPSTVITSSSGNDDNERSSAEISKERQSTVARLRRRLQGDLDNITLTALRKEPERRYASARALSNDIDNYLSNRPISARPEGVAYLSGKFVRRHRVGVALTMAVLLILGASAIQVIEQRDRAEAQAATAKRVSDFLVSMLESSNPYERSAEVTARTLLDRGARQIDVELAGEPLISARLKITMAKAYSSLGLQNTAAALGEAALDELAGVRDSEFEQGNAHTTLARIEHERQNYALAKSMAETALSLYKRSATEATIEIALARIELSKSLMRLDETELMLVNAEQAVELLTRHYGSDHPQTNSAIANLSSLYNEVGNYNRAKVMAEQVVEWIEHTYGEDDILVAGPLHSLGRITWNQGDFRGANRIYERELTILEKSLGPNHPSLYAVLSSLASNQRKIGYASTAKAYYERAIAVLEDSESPALGKLADTYGSLGTLIMDEGHLDEAEPLVRRALELSQQVYGEGNAANAFRLMHLGGLHRKRGEFGRARDYMQQSIDATLRRYPETHRDVQIMRLQLGITEAGAGNYELAREILEAVLTSLETHQGADHPLVGQTLLELAVVNTAEEDYETADERLVRALEIYRSLRDKWHPDIEMVLRLRATIHSSIGKHDVAARLTAEADFLKEGRQKVSVEEARESRDAEF